MSAQRNLRSACHFFKVSVYANLNNRTLWHVSVGKYMFALHIIAVPNIMTYGTDFKAQQVHRSDDRRRIQANLRQREEQASHQRTPGARFPSGHH